MTSIAKRSLATPIDISKSSSPSTQWALRAQSSIIRIDAFVEKAGEWLTIVTIENHAAIEPARIAEQIIRAVNHEETFRALLDDMAIALESCLACDRLDFTAEHDGEITLSRYRSIVGK